MIRYQVLISEPAQEEIIEALKWYRERSQTAYENLKISIDKNVELLATHPKLFSKKHQEIRAIVLRKFPYSIYFIVVNYEVRVLSFFHHSREPLSWLNK